MLRFTDVKRNKKELLALTGLTIKEYNLVLPEFERVYQQRYEGDTTRSGQPRKRKVGGGASSSLDEMEDKLLFILVYQKTYPLQVVLGRLFGMGQSAANQWIHRLLPVLQEALTVLGFMPERNGPAFASAERSHPAPKEYIIDGTERRRQRPQNPERQALHYSGKQKQHTDKNIVITHAKTKRVGFLSPTRPGIVHDKKLAEHEQIAFPKTSILYKDTGFQGYEPPVRQTHQPKKSRGGAS
jgi:Helix-turn-helix of DDE superfamily endonuclease/DDE superfamily endonuclease